MPYVAKHLEIFIEGVHKEAEIAAQAIYDKHQAKFNELISNQVPSGHHLIIGNGTTFIRTKDNEVFINAYYKKADKFSDVLSQVQYKKIDAGFDVIDVDKRIVNFQH